MYFVLLLRECLYLKGILVAEIAATTQPVCSSRLGIGVLVTVTCDLVP